MGINRNNEKKWYPAFWLLMFATFLFWGHWEVERFCRFLQKELQH